MRFHPLDLAGTFRIETEPVRDERGAFARTYCRREFAAQGLCVEWVQCNTSLTLGKGSLRGLHYQAAPHAEAKLIRCTAGAVHDVAVDLRPGSQTFLRWIAVRLDAEALDMFYLPEGVAHGFQVLTEHAELFYQMSASYEPAAARGVRWDDPLFNISWPLPVGTISPRDAGFADFKP
jgi:dTDP-4-dehydrorhamnose 3,5-epimerase